MTPTTPAQPSVPAEGSTSVPSGPPAPVKGGDQSGDELWTPLRSWVAHDPSRYVFLAAMSLLLVQALVRGFVVLGGWYLYDDYAFMQRAATMDLWSPDYLLHSWNGHVMPGAFVWVHLLTSIWPLNYTVVGLTDLAAQALVGYLVYRILVELFGRRPVVLVPLVLFLFTTLTLPASTWWAVALNQLPGQAAAAGALLCQVRYHRTGRSAYGVAGAVCVLMGLLFSELLLLMVPVLFIFTLLWFTSGPPISRLRTCLHQGWRVWVAYAVVVLPYAVLYLVLVPSEATSHPDAGLVLRTAGTALVKAIIPAALGGPYVWAQLGIPAVGIPPTAVVVLGIMTTALVVVVSVTRRRRAVFAWWVIAAYWLVNSLLLGLTRASAFGPNVALEYRYSTDMALIAAVFVPLAFIPLHGRFARGTPQLLRPRPGTASTLPPWPGRRTVGTAVTACLAVGSVFSTLQFDEYWRNDVTSRFIATARTDLDAAPRTTVLADGPPPAAASPGGIGSATSLSTLLATFRPAPRFLTAGGSSTNLFTLDDTGHVRAAVIAGPTNRPGPYGACGWRLGKVPQAIPLRGSTVAATWVARIGYLAARDADTTVTVGSVTTPVHLVAGVNQVYVVGKGAVDEVFFSGISAGTACTDEIVVGGVQALPGSHP